MPSDDPLLAGVHPGRHDLRLPAWGPYGKSHLGISHVADPARGVRFDLSVVPGYFRRRVDVPHVLWESGYHPWEASGDGAWFAHRHELEWKDRVFCDIGFARWNDRGAIIRCACVNRTGRHQNLSLQFLAGLAFPGTGGKIHRIHECWTVETPGGVRWVDALAYRELTYAQPLPQDGLVYDNWRRGEVRDGGFTDGAGLGAVRATWQRVRGCGPGDRVAYALERPVAAGDGILIRFRPLDDRPAAIGLDGAASGTVPCDPRSPRDAAGFIVAVAPIAAGGGDALAMRFLDGGRVEVDGFAIGPLEALAEVRFAPRPWQPRPEIAPGPAPRSLLLRYPDLPGCYGVHWPDLPHELRQIHAAEIDRILRFNANDHVTKEFRGEGLGHFANVFLRPIVLPPGGERVLHGLVCHGDEREVAAALGGLAGDAERCESLCDEARGRRWRAVAQPAGRDDVLGQELMAATMLTNVVYPVVNHGAYIRHYTPGRWWDSLYTWDSGFVGLGLLELDADRAVDCLNAYLNPAEEGWSAFVHHGSPILVQAWLYQEIFNRTGSRAALGRFHGQLVRAYRFLAGRHPGSTAGRLGSGLISLYDYFYNGGWDDYPAQVETHRQRLAGRMAPAIHNAQLIRIARILRGAAAILGRDEAELAAYDRDIAGFADALQRHAWDEEVGYFSFVLHDEAGRPTGPFRDPSGANYNQGLDGVWPLIAGACTPAQRERLIGHLFDPRRLWTRIGITTVDQSAPYFRPDGYWNGAVWMPHQWFLWKTMLDLGRGDEAFRIARTALDLWREETGDTYDCFEHFLVESGRGAGWHHFGGLSSPVLAWFAAYYRPGRLTVGSDLWITAQEGDGRRIAADLAHTGTQTATAIACLAEGGTPLATLDGRPAAVRQRLPQTWEIAVPPGRWRLEVRLP